MASIGYVKFALLGSVLLLSGISYYVAVTFGVVPAPHKYWKQMFTRMEGRDVDSLCNVVDTKDCTDKEKGYIVKMKAKTQYEIQKQHARLDGMKDDAMSAELKQWLHQRLNILKGLGASPENVKVKPWRVCNAVDTTDCTEKEKMYIEKMKGKTQDEIEKQHARLDSMKGDAMKAELKQWLHQRLRILEGLRAPPVEDEVKPSKVIEHEEKPWRVKERGDLKEEAKEPEKKEEEPAKEVKEAEKKLGESPEDQKEEETETTTATSDGEEDILEL